MSHTPLASDNQNAFLEMKKHWESKAGKTLLTGGVEKNDIQKILEIVQKKQKSRILPSLLKKTDDFISRVNNRINKLQKQADKTKKPVDPQQLHQFSLLLGACNVLKMTAPGFFENNTAKESEQKTLKAIKELEAMYQKVKDRKHQLVEPQLRKFYTDSLGIDLQKRSLEAEERKSKSKAHSQVEKNRLDDFLQNIRHFAGNALLSEKDLITFLSQLDSLTPTLQTLIAPAPIIKGKIQKEFWKNDNSIAAFLELICAENLNAHIKHETNTVMQNGVTRLPDALKAVMNQKGLTSATDTPALRRFTDSLFQCANGSEIKKALLSAAKCTLKNPGVAREKPLHIEITDDSLDDEITPFTPSVSRNRSGFFDSSSRPSIASTTLKDSASNSSVILAKPEATEVNEPLSLAADLMKQLKIHASKIILDLNKSVSFSPTSRKIDVEKIFRVDALMKSIKDNSQDAADLKKTIEAAKQKDLPAVILKTLKQFESKLDKALQQSPTSLLSRLRS
ncbi:MAG: hypothetical protein P4M14_10560 [Gammaproteobacteria bacterium]|nr:hypothetical protein [Gammaproteobacteria bacterium]